MPTARFFFDYGSGTVLWADPADQETWGYAIDLDQLPVNQALRNELTRLIARYDTSLNWDSPSSPGPWREAQCHAFNEAALRALCLLQDELSPDWQITDSVLELHEDPDLDRYLADPPGFAR